MTNYCKRCGEKLTPGQEHDCPKKIKWSKLKIYLLKFINKIGPNEDVDESEWLEKGKSIVTDVVDPTEGEITVKQYDVARLRTRLKGCKADGKMQITNKRVLFRAAGKSLVGRTTYQSEFDISHIEGVEICKDYRFMWLDFFIAILLMGWSVALGFLVGGALVKSGSIFLNILTILCSIATSIPFYMMRKHYKIKLFSAGVGGGLLSATIASAALFEYKFLMILGVITAIYTGVLFFIAMFFSFFQPNLAIVVQSSTAATAIQAVAVYSGYDEVLPSGDTDLVIKEIGAIINDIKTLGDLGIDKWKTK